jgi:ubiquinone/menaquinone biosynthesis C-methylase UbiE
MSAGGPPEHEFEQLRLRLDALSREREEKAVPMEALRASLLGLGPPFSTPDSLMGLTLRAERHGAFEVMHRLYRRTISSDERLRRWDEFYHWLDAAEAVRSRKSFVVNLLAEFAEEHPGARVLNVGSGPGDDVVDFFRRCGPALRIDCLDTDAEALAFARERCREWLPHVSFSKHNALFLRPKEPYDLAVSVGLTDYLSNRVAGRLLHRLLRALRAGGSAIIANFGRHQSRGAMACSGWRLIERTPEDLLRLGREAGGTAEHIWVASEPLGLVHFLAMRGGATRLGSTQQ